MVYYFYPSKIEEYQFIIKEWETNTLTIIHKYKVKQPTLSTEVNPRTDRHFSVVIFILSLSIFVKGTIVLPYRYPIKHNNTMYYISDQDKLSCFEGYWVISMIFKLITVMCYPM